VNGKEVTKELAVSKAAGRYLSGSYDSGAQSTPRSWYNRYHFKGKEKAEAAYKLSKYCSLVRIRGKACSAGRLSRALCPGRTVGFRRHWGFPATVARASRWAPMVRVPRFRLDTIGRICMIRLGNVDTYPRGDGHFI